MWDVKVKYYENVSQDLKEMIVTIETDSFDIETVQQLLLDKINDYVENGEYYIIESYEFLENKNIDIYNL